MTATRIKPHIFKGSVDSENCMHEMFGYPNPTLCHRPRVDEMHIVKKIVVNRHPAKKFAPKKSRKEVRLAHHKMEKMGRKVQRGP